MKHDAMQLTFDNAFVRDLPGDTAAGTHVRQVEGALYSRVLPTPVVAPRLLAYSGDMAARLGMNAATVASDEFAQVFGGNALLDGMQPFAANYGGHQFGNWAGQLGDGRAISLGEAITPAGERWELQLKGAGRTPYSRGADGRAVLRSSVREFLCSEAMHHLGIPTTRALCLIDTGEAVVRDMFYDGHAAPEPGAIVCRVAPSFIRFGSFELPYARNDVALLRQLADFTIRRDFPHLADAGEHRYADWFGEVCERTAHTVAQWMRVGFVHGVMNTDNLSIMGLTLDYGPYGWIDNFDLDWTPNTTDAGRRRYRFGAQANVAGWNLSRLAQALSPLFADTAPLQVGLDRYVEAYQRADRANMAAKLGVAECAEPDVALMHDLHTLLRDGEVDMTLFFRALGEAAFDVPGFGGSDVQAAIPSALGEAFYDDAKRQATEPRFRDWLTRYAKRLASDPLSADARLQRMRAANPLYVLRNYLAQQAIDSAAAGDTSVIHTLLEVLRNPCEQQPGREAFAQKRPDWARHKAGCSMLSCSS